jgi:hypothetical protein
MGRQARGVQNSWSVSTFASVALVPALDVQPRRTPRCAYWRELLSTCFEERSTKDLRTPSRRGQLTRARSEVALSNGRTEMTRP